jgi:hypothetical protein
VAESTALDGQCPCGKHALSDETFGGVLCGADTRQEEAKYPTCHRPAGWGTPNGRQNYTRCKLHGGSNRVTTGAHVGAKAKARYGVDTVRRPRVAELMEQMADDPNPLDILPELAAARAIFIDFVERYDEWREALLAWNDSFGKEGTAPKPKQILDVSAAMAHLDIITKIAEREWKRHEANAISRKDLFRVMDQMARAVMRVVTDEQQLKAIRAEWLNVSV